MRKRLKKLISGIICTSMGVALLQTLGSISAPTKALAADTSIITLDGNDVNADNVNGLTYKGFGLLTANSTSDLLLDYKAEHPEKYMEMMQSLFGGERPIMTHVKIEMGNDRNNSTGAEACTMRTEDEEANVRRNVGFQLAADAKKINPDVKVSILRWNKPAWAKTNKQTYEWYKKTILAAYETYGYMVDYVNPNVNERWDKNNDVNNTKEFAGYVKAENSSTISDPTALALYQKMKYIVTDEAEQFAEDAVDALKTDEEFAKIVSVAGYHYPNTATNKSDLIDIAEKMDKEVWCSEGQATFSDSVYRPATGTGIGGTCSALEMGNFIIKSFQETRRTHVVYQPAISAFYQGGQYSSKELITAQDPWSGYVRYDAGLLVLNHLSKFAVTGWENETNTAGIWRAVPTATRSTVTGDRTADGMNDADSYLTLASPDKKDFSTICVNNSPYKKTYSISVKNMNMAAGKTLEQWETKAASSGAYDSNYMKYLGDIKADASGNYTFEVEPYSVVTVSTLSNKNNPEVTDGLPKSDTKRSVLDMGGDTLYEDDFDYSGKTMPIVDDNGKIGTATESYIEARGGETSAVARYTHIVNGAFEAYKRADGQYVLRQQLDDKATGVGSAWGKSDAVALIGDYRWMNYKASVDILFEDTKASASNASISIRQTAGGTRLSQSAGYTFTIDKTGAWTLVRKKTTASTDKKNDVVASGTITDTKVFSSGFNAWNNIALEGNGNVITAYVNNKLIATYKDTNPITSGRVGLGSSYAFTQFDNLKITKVKEKPAYYSEYIDNLELFSKEDVTSTKLKYNGNWSHQCAQGMFVYDRSASFSNNVGDSLTYTFTGCGVDVIGTMKADKCKLKVTVDGKVTAKNAVVSQADDMGTNFSVSNLAYGKHTVAFEVTEGKWCVDAIGIHGNDGVTVRKGDKHTIGALKYVVTDVKKNTVAVTGLTKKSAKSVTIPATVKVDGKSYKVTAINTKAFYNCKSLKTIKISSTTISSVGKNAISGIDKKAVIKCNKKCVKAYKKLFSKKTGFKKTMKIK